MSIKIGDCVRMTRWSCRCQNMNVAYTSGKKQAAVFVFLGYEPLDESHPLDVDIAMNNLGWFTATARDIGQQPRGEEKK